METSELLKKVRKIEIKTKALSRQIFSGQYHSAFKGRGMAFSEVREYQYGDDVRFIDWKVTARFNHPYIKVFEEERELTVMLLIDVSASGEFGSGADKKGGSKRESISEIAAILAFSAAQNNDKVGAIFFSSEVEKYIPPQKGRTHLLHIIRELVNFEPTHPGTDIGQALKFLRNVQKRKSSAFVLSDFMDSRYEDALKIAGKAHEIVALQVYDPLERELPDWGLVRMHDNETGEEFMIDTASKANREAFAKFRAEEHKNFDTLMNKYGIVHTSISTQEDYVKPLLTMFGKL